MSLFNKEQLREPTINRRRSKSLFREFGGNLLNLTDDHDEEDGTMSLKKLYLSFCVEDPTEINFAEAVFGDWDAWEYLLQSFLKEDIEKWRMLCTIKRKSQAFQAIIEEVKNDGRSKFTAAKYLIEEPWIDKRSSEAKKKSKSTTVAARGTVRSDIERLRKEGLLQ